MQGDRWAKLIVGAALGLGCAGPSLDLPDSARIGDSLVFEPNSDTGTVPLLFSGALAEMRRRAANHSCFAMIFRTTTSAPCARTEVPTALARARCTAAFLRRDGADCWLQPVVWLEPDVSYAIAYTGVGKLQTIRAAAGAPLARRLFPPAGSRKHRVSVLCMDNTASAPDTLALEPGAVTLRVSPGIAGTPGDGCITLQVDGKLSESVVTPPVMADALLDPSPWLPSPTAADAPAAPHCAAGAAFFGACLEISDDRVFVTPSGDDQLWLLSGPQKAVIAARPAARSVLVRGLMPASAVELQGAVLSGLGRRDTFLETTSRRSPHDAT